MKTLLFLLLLVLAIAVNAAPTVGFEDHNLHCAYDVGDETSTNIISNSYIGMLSPQLVSAKDAGLDYLTLGILSEYGLVRCSYIGNFTSYIATNAFPYFADYSLPMVIPLVAVYYGIIEPIKDCVNYFSTYSKASSC